MLLLHNRKIGNSVYLLVHADESKVLADDDARVGTPAAAKAGDRIITFSDGTAGSPDPDWVLGFQWAVKPPPGVSASDHKAAILRETKLLVQAELTRRQADTEAGVSQGGEGQAL